MKVLGVIPARYGSVRFPGKPLIPLLGKPLIQWVAEAVAKSQKIDEWVVATDHQEIYDCVVGFGGTAVMTASELPSGTDRTWAVAQERECDIAVNIQGDEPLISGQLLDQLVEVFTQRSEVSMATLGRPITEVDLQSENTAKIVLDHKGDAIYFSRYPIPYSRHNAAEKPGACLKHIGLYAYRKDFLQSFCQQAPVEVELCEGLEQLRAIYMGAKISVVQVEHESWGVDTPEDVAKVEEKLKARLS